jgi:GNAT superfamily N-acetyltransferase
MNDLHIRNADVCDQEAIRDVTLSAYEEYAAKMPPDAWEEYRANIVSTLADVKPAEQIVAEQSGRVVGSVLLYPAGTFVHVPDDAPIVLEFPEVRLLAVAPKARGQGIGTALMQECIRRARVAGVPILTLHTTDMMEVGMRMYERLGFQRAPEIDFYPAENVVVKGYRFDLARKQPA